MFIDVIKIITIWLFDFYICMYCYACNTHQQEGHIRVWFLFEYAKITLPDLTNPNKEFFNLTSSLILNI